MLEKIIPQEIYSRTWRTNCLADLKRTIPSPKYQSTPSIYLQDVQLEFLNISGKFGKIKGLRVMIMENRKMKKFMALQNQSIFFENYDKINIPVYFVMGLRDTLIEPVSVLAHYASLHEQHPNLAYLKAFPKMGHIDFTVGENSKVTNFIFHTISELNQPKKVLEEHATHSSTESDKEFFYEKQQKISSDKGQTTVKKTTKKNYHNKKKPQ